MKIKSKFNTELAAKVAVEKEKLANLPPARECRTLEFTFSERQFPAPKRESNKIMEEKWEKQQKEALKKISEKHSGSFVKKLIKKDELKIKSLNL